ncbi:PilZ domain-containing protein [Oceanisphaera sp. W20_SRM_FM3]|uniref:PilZ domain-containing protein n=1 Tax=Oceanisphaera sp. W20_SRM_FM3 TaxID=3240267 RepID=UPI003F9A8177
MPFHPYLSEEEIALLSELYQADSDQSCLTLSLLLDKQVAPLLEQASRLELKLELGEVMLSFPVTLSPHMAPQEHAELSVPNIISNGGHPRSWRLPSPQHIQLKRADGKPLAAEIRDLSTNGMRLLSRRSLFAQGAIKKRPQMRTLLMVVGQETLRLVVTLVREHKGPAFWVTAVQFQLSSADQRTLSDFVFKGFLAQIEKKQAP